MGELDELGIAGTARSAAWVRASYASQGPEGQLATIGEEMLGEGGGRVAGVLPCHHYEKHHP